MSEIRMGLLQNTLGVTKISFAVILFLFGVLKISFGVLGAWGKQKTGLELIPALLYI